MNILDYIGSMSKDLDRHKLRTEVKQMRSEITDYLLPAYEQAAEFFLTTPFMHDAVKRVSDEVATMLHTKQGTPYPVIIVNVLRNADEQLSAIEKLINNDFAEDLVPAGMTFFKIAVMQQIEAISFFTNYSGRLLNLTYTAEADARGSDLKVDKVIPAEQKFIEENFKNYLIVLGKVNVGAHELTKKIETAPDTVVTEDSLETVHSIKGTDGTDPMGMNFIPIKLNPIFHLRMWLEGLAHKRYEKAKVQKRVLEIKLLHLKQLSEDQRDAKTEKLINDYEDELNKLSRSIQKTEEEYA